MSSGRFRVRGCHPLWPRFPARSAIVLSPCRRRSYNPARCLDTRGLGSCAFARHYWRNHCYFLFLRVLRCFSSPRSPHVSHGDRPSACRVAPFGHIRINVCLRLPVHFRSLPRPSSPPDSLGILRSLFSSFSRVNQSASLMVTHHQRDSIRLVAYVEIAVPNSQLEKTLEFLKLQTDFLYLSLPLILSQCCQ